MEELPRLKSQQISSYASPPEPFDFPSEIAGLPRANKTVLHGRGSSDGDANSLPPGHFLFRISSILRSEVRVALSFSLFMRSSKKCMPPKYYRIELKDTGNCVHISNIKGTSIQYIQ